MCNSGLSQDRNLTKAGGWGVHVPSGSNLLLRTNTHSTLLPAQSLHWSSVMPHQPPRESLSVYRTSPGKLPSSQLFTKGLPPTPVHRELSPGEREPRPSHQGCLAVRLS